MASLGLRSSYTRAGVIRNWRICLKRGVPLESSVSVHEWREFQVVISEEYSRVRYRPNPCVSSVSSHFDIRKVLETGLVQVTWQTEARCDPNTIFGKQPRLFRYLANNHVSFKQTTNVIIQTILGTMRTINNQAYRHMDSHTGQAILAAWVCLGFDWINDDIFPGPLKQMPCILLKSSASLLIKILIEAPSLPAVRLEVL